MSELPERPDLAQLRRQAKELHRAAAEGNAEAIRRLRAVSDRTTLSAAQLAVAREYGFGSWSSLRAAVEARRTNLQAPLMHDKYRHASIYDAADFLSSARTRGWSSGLLPVGVVFTSQTFITSHLEAHPERYRPSGSLTPTNGQVFLTVAIPPVAIACLGLGAPAVVALLEHLVGLGVRAFVAVGPAPAVSPDLNWGDCPRNRPGPPLRWDLAPLPGARSLRPGRQLTDRQASPGDRRQGPGTAHRVAVDRPDSLPDDRRGVHYLSRRRCPGHRTVDRRAVCCRARSWRAGGQRCCGNTEPGQPEPSRSAPLRPAEGPGLHPDGGRYRRAPGHGGGSVTPNTADAPGAASGSTSSRSTSSSRYSLAGVRAATTAPHEAFIAKAKEVLSADDRVLAAYLVGGFAVGMGDAFSDVDLQVLVADDAADDLATSWPELIHRIAPTVQIQAFGTLSPNTPRRGPTGGLCITPDWLHFDVVFHRASQVDAHAIEGMVPLLDKAGLLPTAPTERPDRRGDPFFPETVVSMFLYMLGNVVSAIGRNEPVPASNGVIIIRDIALVGLFLAEGGLASTREHTPGSLFPFTKRLRRYLTDEQHAVLESLPPLSPSIDSAIDGYVALAEAFLPRARRLAKATGARWPEEYEHASVAFFERSLGVKLRL